MESDGNKVPPGLLPHFRDLDRSNGDVVKAVDFSLRPQPTCLFLNGPGHFVGQEPLHSGHLSVCPGPLDLEEVVRAEILEIPLVERRIHLPDMSQSSLEVSTLPRFFCITRPIRGAPRAFCGPVRALIITVGNPHPPSSFHQPINTEEEKPDHQDFDQTDSSTQAMVIGSKAQPSKKHASEEPAQQPSGNSPR